MHQPSNNVYEELIADLKEILGLTYINETKTFKELGTDSIDFVEILLVLEEAYNLECLEYKFSQDLTVIDAVSIIKEEIIRQQRH